MECHAKGLETVFSPNLVSSPLKTWSFIDSSLLCVSFKWFLFSWFATIWFGLVEAACSEELTPSGIQICSNVIKWLYFKSFIEDAFHLFHHALQLRLSGHSWLSGLVSMVVIIATSSSREISLTATHCVTTQNSVFNPSQLKKFAEKVNHQNPKIFCVKAYCLCLDFLFGDSSVGSGESYPDRIVGLRWGEGFALFRMFCLLSVILVCGNLLIGDHTTSMPRKGNPEKGRIWPLDFVLHNSQFAKKMPFFDVMILQDFSKSGNLLSLSWYKIPAH